jgi:lipoate-protein ligase B
MEWFYLGEIPFEQAYRLQLDLHRRRLNQEIPDTLLGLIHPPCITVGRMADIRDVGNRALDLPVYVIERGGRLTYHGPGQLVCYFIWDMKRLGLKGFLDLLEDILKGTLLKLGIEEEKIRTNLKGRGVWIGDKKVASIGIAVKRWVSFHGVSLNLGEQVHDGLRLISPCVLKPDEVCCLEHHGIKVEEREIFDIMKEVILGSRKTCDQRGRDLGCPL